MWFLYCPGSIKPPGLISFLDSKLWESAASAAKSGTPKWNSQGFCWSGVDITQPSCKDYATASLQSSLQLIPCKFNVAFLGQFIEGHVGFGKIPTLHRNISGDLLAKNTVHIIHVMGKHDGKHVVKRMNTQHEQRYVWLMHQNLCLTATSLSDV